MSEERFLVEVIGMGEGGGCGWSGAKAAGDGPSEQDKVLQLGEKIAAMMPHVETKYYDYRVDEVPDALDTIINTKQLSLPAVFINGKASFAGGLPGVHELFTSIQKKLAK